MTHPLSKTRIDECSNEIPVFLFFTWARNNRSDGDKQFIPNHDSTKHSGLPWCEMWYHCTHSQLISDSDPCSLGVIADARVTKAAHHTPESANQICFPPSCRVTCASLHCMPLVHTAHRASTIRAHIRSACLIHITGVRFCCVIPVPFAKFETSSILAKWQAAS